MLTCGVSNVPSITSENLICEIWREESDDCGVTIDNGTKKRLIAIKTLNANLGSNAG